MNILVAGFQRETYAFAPTMATYDSFVRSVGNSSVPNSGAAFGAIHDENSGSAHNARAAFDTGCNRSKQGDPSMDTINLPDDVNHDRRHFFGTAAFAIAVAQLALTGRANAQSAMTPQPGNKKPAVLAATKPGANNHVRRAEADRCRPSQCRIR